MTRQQFLQNVNPYCHCEALRPRQSISSESGRSRVEMLGTLAVMGVLTIGGIAGFNYAMDKSKANDILDGVNKRAVALSTYTMLGTNISTTTLNAEFSNHIGDASVALIPDGAGFKLTVSGLTDSVCDKVLDNGLKMASKISLGETTVWEQGEKSDHDCAEKDNEIVFAFNASLDGSKTCGYCQHKENNTCVADATCDNGCPGDEPLSDRGYSCNSCNSSYWVLTNTTECATCSNRFWSPYTAGNPIGWCLSCNTDDAYKADAEECAKCPGRKMLNTGYCALKECTDGQFRTNDGTCYPCSKNSYPVAADATECAKCPEREMLNGKCALTCAEEEFRSGNGTCVSCSGTGMSDANATECAKCPNRFRTAIGWCLSCSDGSIPKADAAECAKCSERKMQDGQCIMKECPEGQFRKSNNACASCSDNSPISADTAECAKCFNREMRNGKCAKICTEEEFENSNGTCVSCSYISSSSADASECAKCPNREMKNGKCVQICPEGQFRDNGGFCITCSAIFSYDADATECAKCSERKMQDGKCVLK